jgi:chromosome segregation ATPase
MDRGHSEMMDELEAIAAERAELQTLLEHEREEREKSEEELKNRMGEEQRLLIHEAENRMNELRMKAEQLESSLEQSESEGYQARQEAEELRDQNKEIEGSCLSLEDAVSDLKSLIEGQENQVSVLQSELKKAKAESYASKESAIEMKDKMRKSSRENEKVMRESQAISSEVSALKRKIASLERDVMQRREESERLKAKLQTAEQGYTDNIQRDETIKQLQEVVKSKDEHIESLTRAVAKLEGESKGMTLGLKMAQARTSSDVSDDSNRLQKKIDRLNTQMKQKDARIKKLEAVRLTKEQVESIKKLKVRNASIRSSVLYSVITDQFLLHHSLILSALKRSVQAWPERTLN